MWCAEGLCFGSLTVYHTFELYCVSPDVIVFHAKLSELITSDIELNYLSVRWSKFVVEYWLKQLFSFYWWFFRFILFRLNLSCTSIVLNHSNYNDFFTVNTQCLSSHHITSHHITSHHITSHHITSHHITSVMSGLILSCTVFCPLCGDRYLCSKHIFRHKEH